MPSTGKIETTGTATYDRRLVKRLLADRARKADLAYEFGRLFAAAMSGALKPIVAERDRQRVKARAEREAAKVKRKR